MAICEAGALSGLVLRHEPVALGGGLIIRMKSTARMLGEAEEDNPLRNFDEAPFLYLEVHGLHLPACIAGFATRSAIRSSSRPLRLPATGNHQGSATRYDLSPGGDPLSANYQCRA